jgi:transcriptional regulator with XRE-family HTH domain
LEELRRKRGLTLEQVVNLLAAQLQIRISRSALSRYETGSRKAPDALLLWGLARIYQEPLDDLVARSRNRTDLIRHTEREQSADAAATTSRDAALAALQDAGNAIARATAALHGEPTEARRHAPPHARVHRRAG